MERDSTSITIQAKLRRFKARRVEVSRALKRRSFACIFQEVESLSIRSFLL